jgi:hypothetical protein
MLWMLDVAGPPGLVSSEPMRCRWSVAGSLISASEILGPAGLS